MIIDFWKGVVDYFKIEITHFMIDSFRKFAVSNTDIQTQEAVLFVTECTTSEQQCLAIYISFQCHQNTLNLLYKYHLNIRNYMIAISTMHSQFWLF